MRESSLRSRARRQCWTSSTSASGRTGHTASLIPDDAVLNVTDTNKELTCEWVLRPITAGLT